jgi:hypothetical protein
MDEIEKSQDLGITEMTQSRHLIGNVTIKHVSAAMESDTTFKVLVSSPLPQQRTKKEKRKANQPRIEIVLSLYLNLKHSNEQQRALR